MPTEAGRDPGELSSPAELADLFERGAPGADHVPTSPVYHQAATALRRLAALDAAARDVLGAVYVGRGRVVCPPVLLEPLRALAAAVMPPDAATADTEPPPPEPEPPAEKRCGDCALGLAGDDCPHRPNDYTDGCVDWRPVILARGAFVRLPDDGDLYGRDMATTNDQPAVYPKPPPEPEPAPGSCPVCGSTLWRGQPWRLMTGPCLTCGATPEQRAAAWRSAVSKPECEPVSCLWLVAGECLKLTRARSGPTCVGRCDDFEPFEHPPDAGLAELRAKVHAELAHAKNPEVDDPSRRRDQSKG